MNFLQHEFLQYQFLGNSVLDYAQALVAFVGFLLIFKIFQSLVLRRLKKLAERTKTDIDDTLIKVVKSIRPPFYSYLAFYLALQFLTLNFWVAKLINAILIIWVVYQAIKVIQILINYVAQKSLGKEEESLRPGGPQGPEGGTRAAIQAIGILSKVVLWSLGLLLVLSNLGVDITALVAGLGIGGIAIALAVQNILGDLFSSFAIYFDKPFVVGDFIIVGDTKGTVEKIGIKTTRIKALQGEEIVISNKELTSARVQNFKKMQERRVTFAFGVVYETPTEKLKQIPKMVEDIVQEEASARFDRAHFNKFSDSSLDFEVVYYISSSDYNEYMNIHQEILFKIKAAFEKEKISMAYPTQTIYLEK